MPELFQKFLTQLARTSPIEAGGAITGLISVYYFVKKRPQAWPWGIASVILYYFAFRDVQLYSDAALQVYFLLIQIYGWWAWVRGDTRENPDLPIRLLSTRERRLWAVVIVVLAVILGYLMDNYTIADLPYPDAAAAAVSIVAQYFLTRRIFENWALWIGVDILYAFYIYPAKGLYPTTLLYALFLILAVQGHREWWKIYQTQQTQGKAIEA
jgi:nicotinamide mononucleotide transporter